MHSRWSPTLALIVGACLLYPGSAHGQEAARGMAMTPPDLPVHRNELVRVVNREEDRVAEFVIGPLELKAGMPHYRAPIQMAEIPVDGWMHGFEVAMLDGEGNPIPMEALHHVNLIDPDKREIFSPIARRVMAAGRETAAKELPRLLGYPLQAGDRLLIATMFANPTESDYPEAYLHVRLAYSLEEDGFLQPRDVYPFYLDVMGPVGAKDFPVPPGKTVRTWEGSPVVQGRIMGIGGHLHNYATALRLEDVTAGKTIWEAEPELDAEGKVVGVPIGKLWWRGGAKIRPDHVYRIAVEYDNPTGEPAPDGGMGEIGGVVWVAKDASWPPFDRQDPEYVEDLTNTLTAPERMTHGHGSHGAMEHGEAAGHELGHEAEPEAGHEHGMPMDEDAGHEHESH